MLLDRADICIISMHYMELKISLRLTTVVIFFESVE